MWDEAGYAFQSDGHEDSTSEGTNPRGHQHGAARWVPKYQADGVQV